MASSAALQTDISRQQPQNHQQRRSLAAGERLGMSARKYLINSGGGSVSGRWKFKARRRRKRQPQMGGESNNNRGYTDRDAVATMTSTVARMGGNNNNRLRNIYSSADNDKEAFLRNYELNINSPAPRRMNSRRQQRKQEVGGGGDEAEDVMLNDDNVGVLNAVAAVQNGDMVGKHRDDNWMDETDEYYPFRDHFSDLQNLHMPFWDSYDSINQLYLEIGE